jgi:hypothetical protein
MTLSSSKLNEIAYLYENAVHGEQEVLDEDASDAGVGARKVLGGAARALGGEVKRQVGQGLDIGGSYYKGLAGQTTSSKDDFSRATNAVTRAVSSPYRKAAGDAAGFVKGLVTGQGSDKPAAKPPAASTNTPSRFARPQNAAPGLSDIRGGGGNTSPRAGGGSGAAGRGGGTPPGGNNPKVLPTKPAAPAKPAIPTGTTAGGTTFQRRAATGDELRAAQDARAAAKAAGNTKGAEEAAVKAGVAASKPATPSLGQRAAAMPSSGSSQFKPATSTQATNAAGSNSAAASGSLVPASNKIASSLKPIDLKASYEYDVYDLVLEYLLDNGHVDTVEEANYVMMEMDAETIGNIVEDSATLSAAARKRAEELGRKRRSTKEYKQGLNRRTGRNERRAYDLSNTQKSAAANPDTQRTSSRRPSTEDTGMHKGDYDRFNRSKPEKNPKHNENK